MNKWVIKLALGLALTFSSLSPVGAEAKFTFENTPGQLPRAVLPKHYQLTITPDLQKLTFQGSVVIDVTVKQATDTVVLNALELVITKAGLVGGSDAVVTLDPSQQTVTLKFAQPLALGPQALQLDYTGKINAQPQGLYYDKYPTPQGEQTMLATQMEPTDARRMVPSWDEPVYRTTFDLNVVIPKNLLAFSNMPVTSEKAVGKALKRVQFDRTPPMSSYLLVLAVGDFEVLSDEVDGIKLGIVTTRGKKEQGRYALEATKQILPFYNDYFGTKYPLPKLDQIAVPGGFGGAMENWGGITYNESILLFDPKTSTQETKEAIFQVVSHEIAHQWFGNLVTMAWWDNLWLNEGFATWMQRKATARFNPQWEVWLRADAAKSRAMELDARQTTHPVQQPVGDAREAMAAFDRITYLKGGSVIRMLETFLGEDTFRQGLRDYMATHPYSNTTTADLWSALEKSSGKPVSAIAASWTEQPGFPVVQAQTLCENGIQFLDLKQERFAVNFANAPQLQWQIPIALGRVGQGEESDYILLDQPQAKLPQGSCQGVTKLNKSNIGYYRVQYDPTTFERLQASLALLNKSDRVNLLSDTWALVEAGRLTAPQYLTLIQKLPPDPDLAIWEQVTRTLGLIDQLYWGQPERPQFQAYGRALLRPLYTQLGWQAKPKELQTVGLLRNEVLELLGTFEDPQVIQEAQKRFAAFLIKPENLAPDLRPVVLGIVGRYADQATYETLHRLARTTQSTAEQKNYYAALASALNPQLAQKTLELALKDELDPPEAAYLVVRVANLGEHRSLAWSFAQTHMKTLLGKLAAFNQGSYLQALVGASSDLAQAEALNTYAQAQLSAELVPDIAKAVDKIRFQAALKAQESARISQWIAQSIKKST